MTKKSIFTKSKKSPIFLKCFGISLLGGILGAVLTIGIFYVANGSWLSPKSQNANGSPSESNAKVGNMKVNSNSNITDAANKVQDAVVSVINLQKQQSQSGLSDVYESNNETESSNDSSLQETSEGSGVIYKVEGNTAYVVTNNHVIKGQDGLEVLLKDGTRVKATLVGTDSYTDLAVLKVESSKVKDIKAATFGDSDSLKVGEPAITVGSPLGSQYANSVTSGIISSLNRQVVNQNDDGQTININAIQTDAAINPGNSGGPLINAAGQVIGINSSKIVQTASNVSVEGIGFAISSNDVVNVINQLEKEGKVIRPALGISMANLSDLSSKQASEIVKVPSSVTQGVVVSNVQSSTPGDQAGLKKYDVITKIDNTEVSTGVELQSELYKHNVGDTVKITYYRGGKKATVSVKLTLDTSSLKTTTNQQNSK